MHGIGITSFHLKSEEKKTSSAIMLLICMLRFGLAGLQPCREAGCQDDEECQVDEKGLPQCVCPGPCPPIHRPVCGSDGQTYSSTCDLLRQACLQKRHLLLVYEGMCGKFFVTFCTRLRYIDSLIYVCIPELAVGPYVFSIYFPSVSPWSESLNGA